VNSRDCSLQPSYCIAKSDEKHGITDTTKTLDGNLETEKKRYQRQVENLLLDQKKLEFQIRVGLDSFRLEQKRVKQLADELSVCKGSQLSKAAILLNQYDVQEDN